MIFDSQREDASHPKESVAIIVPTLNRQDFLLRTITYYLLDNNIHPIYIGDASPESAAKEIAEYSNNSSLIKYYHLKDMGDRDTMVFLANEAKKDRYEYCAFQGDDDFFIVDALSKAANFLKNHSEYRTAQGNAVSIELDRPGPFGKLVSIGTYWRKPALNKETGVDRVKELSNNYWVPNFSVHRTQEFIEDFTDSHVVKDRNWGEITNCFSCAIKGKSKYLDIFYLIRNVHSRIEHESDNEWRSTKEWSLSYRTSILSLSSKLSVQDKIGFSISEGYIEKELSEYLGRSGDMKASIYQNIRNILVKNKSVYLFLKKVENAVIDTYLLVSSKGRAVQNPKFMISKYSIYNIELKKIRDIVEKRSKEKK